MDWNHELLESLIWLGKAFVLSVIGLAVTATILARFTGWGRQFWRLTSAWFVPSHSKRPLLWLALIVFMSLFAVRMNVLFSFWYNDFYSAMQALDAKKFWFALLVFAVLATIHVGRALLNYYLQQGFQIHWRIWLTNTLMYRWTQNQSYYRTQFVQQIADNPDQRIQQDVEIFVARSMTLATGLLEATVSLFAFSIILWGLSGSLTLFGVEIPRAMVFLVYLYVIVATVLALKIGRPLIRLNFLNEQFSANFRYALIRLREYGESIAFYRGETVEHANLLARFASVIGNMWAIVFRSLKFLGFNLAVSQATTVFPFIVQAPRLFSKQITLGDVMQTAESFRQVADSLSFFRTSYDDFASYRAVIVRLSGFLDSTEAVAKLPTAQIEPGSHVLILDSLTVRTPTQAVLVDKLSFELPKASSLLIRGKSGIGKTTLLRAVAGLWPYVDGKITRPTEENSLFLPQKPYLPLGSLRQALHYPAPVPADNSAADVLRQCHLGHLLPHLDEESDWARTLSLGEQQRLAIGRVLLNRPQLVFLDEASSAMDEGLEYAMYQLLRQSLPETILVSVGHRSSLLEFHTQELELLGDGLWRRLDLPLAVNG